ncbi:MULTISPECIES: RDD family protein [unclassified Stenotrophomonas]|uniref:RDD family protein n=1 Tax=unclassified Stenotrophomonas TaxID=196198 RepID=UPI00104D511F|nr:MULTISPECIES: RDD family protein [unclassified Stenotrophomonas]MDV3516339.1 RDD family protein [Stenotrophomonas sp. C1657]TDB32552.1 RDD family protein [Stenotrophomonas sp. TEPEL]
MTEWYYAEGQQRQGPLEVTEIRQRFQRGQLNLDTLVWREGMGQWAPLRQMVEELGLQTLADASTSTAAGGFDLRNDYAAIDNGTAPLPGTGALSSSPYAAPGAGGSDHSQPVQGGEVVYAGFWKRFAAYLIDYFVLLIPSGVVGGVLGFVLGAGMGAAGSGETAVEVVTQLISGLAGLFIAAAYYGWFHASRGGATLGKMAIGIKVVRGNGDRLTLGRSIGRYFATILSGLTLCIGYLMAAFTERKQGLHDLICDTVVVDRWAYTDQPQLQRRELGTVTIVILVLGGLLMLAGFAAIIFAVGVIANMAS